MAVTAGTTLTCTNDDCPCRVLVQVPCPHGEGEYSCACGHPLVAVGGTGDGAIPPTPGA